MNHFPPEEDDVAMSDVLKFAATYDRLHMIRTKVERLPVGAKIKYASEYSPREVMSLSNDDMNTLTQDGFLVLEWPDPPQEFSASAVNGEVHWLDWHSSETAQ